MGIRFFSREALADFKKHYDATGEYLSVGKLDKRFNVYKKEHAWTADMDQVVCSQSIYKHLGAAITNWIKKRARFPVFKKKGRKDSFSSKNGSAEVKGKVQDYRRWDCTLRHKRNPMAKGC